MTQSSALEERVYSKVREAVGDLITADDVALYVRRYMSSLLETDRAMAATFGNAGLTGIIKEMLEGTVKSAVLDWLTEHHDEVMTQVGVIVQEGVGGGLIKAVNNIFSVDIYALQANIENRLRNARQGF